MADWPQSLKPIGKYLARAKEVHKTNPLVSYYCRYYSLLRAIELRDTTDSTANLFVTSLLEKCEVEKNTIGFDDGTHRTQVEEYALKQFYIADEQDRSGNATRQTATTFYAAMCFLEVCTVFGALPDDLEEKLRYAKWKAADIIKALREGRRPIPGAPGEAQAQEAIEPQESAQPEDDAKPVDTNRSLAPMNHTPSPPIVDQPPRKPLYPGAQRLSPVPPAPPVREYDSQPNEYEPSAPPPMPYAPDLPPEAPPSMPYAPDLPPEAPPSMPYALAPSLPPEAPPYPSSEEVSPLYPPALDAQADAQADYQPAAPKATAPPIPSLMLPDDEPKQNVSRTHATYRRAAPISRPPQKLSREANGEKKLFVRAELGVPKRPLPKTPASPVTTVHAAQVDMKPYKPSVQQTQEAQRLCKYAASALDFEDMKTAVSNLERALQLLKGRP